MGDGLSDLAAACPDEKTRSGESNRASDLRCASRHPNPSILSGFRYSYCSDTQSAVAAQYKSRYCRKSYMAIYPTRALWRRHEYWPQYVDWKLADSAREPSACQE